MSKFENKQGISKITLFKKLHNYCSLGQDWYTNNLTVIIEPGEVIPDYIEIETELNALEGQYLIIEDVVNEISNIVNKYEVKSAHIISEVDDATHLTDKVEKQIVNN